MDAFDFSHRQLNAPNLEPAPRHAQSQNQSPSPIMVRLSPRSSTSFARLTRRISANNDNDPSGASTRVRTHVHSGRPVSRPRPHHCRPNTLLCPPSPPYPRLRQLMGRSPRHHPSSRSRYAPCRRRLTDDAHRAPHRVRSAQSPSFAHARVR